MDISTEVAAIQAASQGETLRQPIVNALDKLNSGTLPTVTAQDEGKILKVGANGWEVGDKSGYMPVPTATMQITANDTYDVTNYSSAVVNVPPSGATLISKTITENGTYDPADDNADGYNEVIVNVDPKNWKDTFSVNWDFANAVNTRESNQYSASGSGVIYTIDGWQLQRGILTISNGGIKLSRYSSDTQGYFMQRYKAGPTAAFVDKTLTLSIIIDGVLYSGSGTISVGAGQKIYFSADGEIIRVYYYSAQNEIATTVDISATISNKLIEAIKLESGTSQSLATQINGVWVLNNSMDSDTEYIKARCGLIYNS